MQSKGTSNTTELKSNGNIQIAPATPVLFPLPGADSLPPPLVTNTINDENLLSTDFPNYIVDDDVNYEETNSSLNMYYLCGVPGVCKITASKTCFNVTLLNCSDCSSVGFGFFIFLILCLGLALLLGNSLILVVTMQMRKKKILTKFDWFKASLAVADLMTGKCTSLFLSKMSTKCCNKKV